MLVIVPARMSSARFPGKALHWLGSRRVLEWVVWRCALARCVTEVCVATSTEEDDDAIVGWCDSAGVAVARGPLDDVCGRVLGVAQTRGADRFVRISGDSPLIDPELIDLMVERSATRSFDVVTNVFPRSFPTGQSVEVITTDALGRLHANIDDPRHREHVTSGFYAAADNWRILNVSSGLALPLPSLAVDAPPDSDRLEALIAAFGGQPGGWKELVTHLGSCR